MTTTTRLTPRERRIYEECYRRGITVPAKRSTRSLVTLRDLYIRTKPPHVRLVPLIPNETQELYLQDIRDACPGFDPLTGSGRLEGIRLDVLKYRQWGCSTVTLGLYLIDCLNNPNTISRVLAHNPTTTSDLFAIAKVMYDWLPPEKKPKLLVDNQSRMEFDNGSIISVLQVGSTGAGRGGTIKNLLESERAFWPKDGNEIEFGLLQSVPSGGNIVRETTANGMEEFYAQYQAARQGQGDYVPLFYGWAPHKEYSDTVPADFVATEEERQKQQGFGLTDGQIMFWRRKSAEAKRLGKDARQEYPLTAEEAFVASGNPRFNRMFLDALLKSFYTLQENNRITLRDDLAPERTETPSDSQWNGTLTTYVEAEPLRTYLLVADVSEGLNKDGKHDNSAFHVYDCESWEQVAHYTSGTAEPHSYALDIATAARLYNTCTVCIERNNHGHAVLEALMYTCHYDNLYWHTDYDATGQTTSKAGFPATPRSKPESVGKLASIIESMAEGEAGFLWRHPGTLEELIHYIKVAGGRTEAETGAHDDDVTCCWMAAALMEEYTVSAPLRGRAAQVFKPMVSGTNRLRR